MLSQQVIPLKLLNHYKKMKNIVIIGAGQLGSRHLQGVVKYPEKLKIFVLDLSEDSLKIAKERENEIQHNHEIVFTQSWKKIPNFLDIVIIATSANIRESIINQLIPSYKVNFLILEKVLFQELEAYKRVNDLLVKHKVITYVNHPRRMFESYRGLQNMLNNETEAIYNVTGGNWGLGCNALHFLDLFNYLGQEKLCEVNVDYLDDELIDSTRRGFIEFTGTITGKLSKGSTFSITSLKGNTSSLTVTILNNDQRFIVQEGGTPQIHLLSKENSFKIESQDFNVEYQSALTNKLLVELLEEGLCTLPTFKEARQTHELFLIAMLEKYNKLSGSNSTILPIT